MARKFPRSLYPVLALALAVLAAGAFRAERDPVPPLPVTVRIAAGEQLYRPAGEFRQGTRVVDAPRLPLRADAIEIMKFQVSEADYARCVADGACRSATPGARADRAQTNVSHEDASAYAAWLARRTGLAWRLPSDAEWQRAAGDRAFDEGFSPEANGADPSRRWIAAYRREVERRGAADPDLHPIGHFGLNDLGLADVAGNIWEWTDSCFVNGTLTPDGTAIAAQSEYCGLRAVQGRHRGFIIGFVRDARSGGCAAGVPPDFLGFRLVRSAA